MKVALIGAQGVGKTTLARKLAGYFDGTYIVKETVRECPYPVDQLADFKTEWWVLSHSILEEREAEEAGHDLVVADRCILDISVYTKLINQVKDGRISDGKRALIEQAINQWLEESPYDLMFFLQVDPEIWTKRDIDDGFRSTDINWYRTLTEEFRQAADRHHVSRRSKLIDVYNNNGIQETFDAIATAIQSADRESRLKLRSAKTRAAVGATPN
jgi:nicotinamide riboside kinase